MEKFLFMATDEALGLGISRSVGNYDGWKLMYVTADRANQETFLKLFSNFWL